MSAFLTMDFGTVLNSTKRPKEITKKKSKCTWQVMEEILLHVSSPSLGGLSQDHVVTCHPFLVCCFFFYLHKLSEAFFSPYSYIDLSGNFDQETRK